MLLIGINGRLHSGKDTAYAVIHDEIFCRGRTAMRTGFADKMKLSGVRALGYKPETIDEAVQLADYLKEHGWVKTQFDDGPGFEARHLISGREFWQLYGTEAHRDILGEDVWVNALLPVPSDPVSNRWEMNKRFNHRDVVVVTDCRFDNEAERILDLGGEVWQIDADARLGPLPPGSHSSEHGVAEECVSRIVDNNGTLEQFEKNVLDSLRYALGASA